MALLARAAWLLRGLPAWPASYSAFLLHFIVHAIASLIKAAFSFVPTTASR
jgi:hypothetical protein